MGRGAWVPQGLKSLNKKATYGTVEAVPYKHSAFVPRRLKPRPAKKICESACLFREARLCHHVASQAVLDAVETRAESLQGTAASAVPFVADCFGALAPEVLEATFSEICSAIDVPRRPLLNYVTAMSSVNYSASYKGGMKLW